MIRTAIRRASVLAATTALAGAAFAGSALANGGEEDLTGIGGPGGAAHGGDVQCVVPIGVAANDAVAILGLTGLLGNTNDTASVSQCNTTAVGGDGGAGSARD